MNTEGTSKTGVYFVSLGCPKNLVDSQVMLGKLKGQDYQLVKSPEEAKVIIVNTCSFIQAAQEESINTILEMAEYKQSAQCQALVVSGCLPQKFSQELEKDIPEIDLMVGTGQYQRIHELLQESKTFWSLGEPLPRRSYIDQPAFIHTEKDERVLTGPTHSAFLKISEGCNRRCSFCIIPSLRGNVRSRSIESLVIEAQGLARQGVKELNLVAQDLTEYGMETKYRENLELLLPELCRVEGIEWIRLHYVYPDQFSEKLLEIFATENKIVKYLDMPIQHTVDRILGLMNRQLRKDRLFGLVSELRERVPDLVFRTSIIVGFPGETEEEFEELVKDLERLQLDHVGVFAYSNEKGSKASFLTEFVGEREKRRRHKRLKGLLSVWSLKKQANHLGKKVAVLLEGVSPESELLLQGRMPTQAAEIDGRVLINDLSGMARLPKPGDFLEVEITEVLPHDFVGRVVGKWKINGQSASLN